MRAPRFRRGFRWSRAAADGTLLPMLKKIFTIVAASALAIALYAPAASACPGMGNKEKVVKKEKNEDTRKDTKKVEKEGKEKQVEKQKVVKKKVSQK